MTKPLPASASPSELNVPHRVRLALTVLRVAVASLLFIHGAARVALGIVDDFGGAFEHWGFPLGAALAWGVTLGELLGGPALAAGLLVRPLTVWFGAQLLAGIVLIHAAAGWGSSSGPAATEWSSACFCWWA